MFIFNSRDFTQYSREFSLYKRTADYICILYLRIIFVPISMNVKYRCCRKHFDIDEELAATEHC